MATGYDVRPASRQSFALPGAAPVQSNSTYQGANRGIRIEGGNAQGDGVAAGPQTAPGSFAAPLGQFFEGLMQPYVERKQSEAIYKGFHAAQEGIALSELSHPNNPVTKIFGPTGFEQGAQFYAGTTAVATWQAAHINNMDALIQMDPQTLSKHLADTSSQVMTGDPFADQIIQKGLINATGPLLNTVVKAKELWQQNDAINKGHTAVLTSARGLQDLVANQLKLGGDTGLPADMSAVRQSVGAFTGLLEKPAGMTEESYHKFSVGIARDAMQSKLGFAVGAMKPGGRWFGGRLTPEEEDKLDTQYETFGHKANADATLPYTQQLLDHDAKVHSGAMTPPEAVADLSRINDAIKKSTGFDVDVFDAKALRADGLTVTDAVIAARNKADDRSWQQHLRQQDWAHDAEALAAKEAKETAAAQITWANGSPVQAIAGGVKKDLVEAQASNDWYNGKLGNIVRTFNQGYVSDAVKAAAKAGVEGSVGEQYNKDFETTYQRWKALYTAKPAAALQYYGPYHQIMQRYDSLVSQHTDPITAFSKTFGDASQYGSADVGRERQTEVNKQIDSVIADQASWNPLGQTHLGANGQGVLKKAVWRHVAAAGTNSPIGTKQLMDEAAGSQTASGEFERYGQFAWSNKAGTVPLAQMLHLQPRDADAVFTATYNKHLALVGAAPNTDPDSIIRYDNNGHPAIVMVVKNKKGNPVRAAITYEDLATMAHAYVSDRTANPIIQQVAHPRAMSAMK